MAQLALNDGRSHGTTVTLAPSEVRPRRLQPPGRRYQHRRRTAFAAGQQRVAERKWHRF
jgi:hypothetical protein